MDFKTFAIYYDDGYFFVSNSDNLRDYLLCIVEPDTGIVSAAYNWSLDCEVSSEFYCPEFQVVRFS